MMGQRPLVLAHAFEKTAQVGVRLDVIRLRIESAAIALRRLRQLALYGQRQLPKMPFRLGQPTGTKGGDRSGEGVGGHGLKPTRPRPQDACRDRQHR